ncbi:MAG: AlkZ family DNA glycosylase [Chloroflexi bacterium]|nr:AlkZ family DNA glycosylase [Chloroflexota bacterium]
MTINVQIARARLRSQRISGARFNRPDEVVAWMGVVQAQDYLGALWAIGLRMQRSSEAAVERALAERSIIRTWPARGTLHFVAASDVRWILNLLAPRTIASQAGRFRQLGLDDATVARSRGVVTRALCDGQQLTRDAMYQALEAAGVSVAGQRGIHLLGRLALEGLICFGARDGKQQTFTLLDTWMPPANPKSHAEALAELARRYFTSHGPATVPDFAWWSGLTVSDAREGLELAGSHLARELIGGQSFWYSPDAIAGAKAPTAVSLLPAFDEYLVSYKDRSAVLDPLDVKRVNAGGGILNPAIVVDGQVVGTWKRTLRRGAVAVAPTGFPKHAQVAESALREAVERYGAFLGLTAEVEA